MPLLWPLIMEQGLEIGFAHQSFKWANNATKNAGVTCVIVGIRQKSKAYKLLFSSENMRVVKNINPYLLDADDLIVRKRASALSELPKIQLGSAAKDNGNLSFSAIDKQHLLTRSPEASQLVKRIYGSQEFIKGIERYCLWITDELLPLAESIPDVLQRIKLVREFRLKSVKEATVDGAKKAHAFDEIRHFPGQALLIPRISSERRCFLPVGFIGEDSIISDQAFAIYDSPPFVFSILSSRLHILWVTTVCGKLESRLRYSNTLGYNE